MQGTPAGLPLGIPGMGELIEGAVQQAAQAERHTGVSVIIVIADIVEIATVCIGDGLYAFHAQLIEGLQTSGIRDDLRYSA